MDALAASDGTIAGQNVGRVVLPSTHVGSPRYMAQLYQDAMAIVAELGSPDLFITFTCNPKWTEITKSLRFFGLNAEGEYEPHSLEATFRADIVAIVFRLKLKELMELLTKKNVLGPVKGFMYTVEFQKRGLPHAHILLIMEDGHKPDPARYDDYVCAEIPDPVADPLLYETVTKCMMHGPCGQLNPNSPCMEDGRCSKNFPRAFSASTTVQADGYPTYRRHNNGRTVPVYVRGRDGQPGRNVNLDNRWVVPYNKRLSLYFNAHINVEICSTVNAVKYIYKYIYKGSDRARVVLRDTVAVGENINEVQVFLNARFISPPEACWRIFAFPLHGRKPSILRLPVHEENQQSITVDLDAEIGEQDVEEAGEKKTMLMAWFEANQLQDAIGDLARTLTYQEFPKHFVWVRRERRWKLRQDGGFAIGRMYFVHPTAGEKFYLRLLLQVQKGCQSFADLKTVDGVVHDSFRAACQALGLLADDGEWQRTLQEAAQFKTGRQLRELFAAILQFCIVADPQALFAENRVALADDLLHRERVRRGIADLLLTREELDVLALWDLELILRDAGRSLNNFPPLRTPNPPPIPDDASDNPLIREQRELNSMDEQVFANLAFDSLNNDQRGAIVAVEAALEETGADGNQPHGNFFFIDGPGGTGKTHVYQILLARLRQRGDIALAVASSGNAATLLNGGRTAHSMFKIPIHVQADSYCTISVQSERAQLLREAKLVVWDEAAMVHRHVLEAFERTCRLIRGSPAPFGGLVVVMGGDFRQTLPVVPNGTREDTVAACIQSSAVWRHVRILRLTINMRVRAALANAAPEQLAVVRAEVERHAEWLLSIGNGDHEDVRLEGDEFPRIRVPPLFQVPSLSIGALINRVYPNLTERFNNGTITSDWLLERAILAPLNSDVHAINATVSQLVPGDEMVYLSSDSVEDAADGEDVLYTSEYLASLHPNGFPPHRLPLKVGVPIMLIRNINPKVGMCNGTRMTVVSLSRNLTIGKIMGGRFAGNTVFVPRVDLISDEDRHTPFKLRRRQFPVVPAWAMTINKAQGQTLSSVGVYLARNVFSHGQLYVAFSRSSSVGGIAVACPAPENEGDLPSVSNVVYSEVLQRG